MNQAPNEDVARSVGFDRVVCLSPIPWAGQWTSRHEICVELARRGAEVLFVDPPANMARLSCPSSELRPTPARLTVTSPPRYLPFGALHRWTGLAGRIIERNARRYADHVASVAGTTGLLINSFQPIHGHRVSAALRADVHLYHRADDLGSFPTVRAHYLELERDVLLDADVVVAVSPAVRAPIAHLRPDAQVVRNGVDVDRFARAARPDPRVRALDRPVAVIVGQVDHRTDPTVVAAAARHLDVVIAGPVAAGHALPRGCTGLGRVAPASIPSILAAADVALVPYVGFAGDPLKVYEYLAAGLPVVGVDGPWADDHPARDVIELVTDPADLGAAAVAAVTARNDDGDERRRQVAAAQTWRHRVDQLLDLTTVGVR